VDIKDARKRAFIVALTECGNVKAACDVAKIKSRQTVYTWRDEDDVFAAQWYDAMTEAGENLETEARRRAMDSSDTLLIFLLKAHFPEKYRERYEVKGEHTHTHKNADEYSDDDLAAIAAGSRTGPS